MFGVAREACGDPGGDRRNDEPGREYRAGGEPGRVTSGGGRCRGKEVVSADFIQGCFMFFPAHIFSLIGGFDTNIFLYYEEMDICYRLSKINYTSELVPETSFNHLHGGSTKPSFMIKKELKISQLYISRKHHNYLKYLTIKSLVLIKTILRAVTTPAYWSLVTIIFTGRYIENSLKQKQKI